MVKTVYRTKHAIGLVSDDGVELLIHIGQDTVKLKGEHFTVHVQDGQRISIGDLLVEFDMDAIQAAGYELVTPIVIANTGQFADVVGSGSGGSIHSGDKLLTVLA
ncbi:PTS system beta-glucoside-specific EIIBCA component [compost metagenome]